MEYLNYYQHCGEKWEDVWDCCCNSECPICEKEIEPYQSNELIEEGLSAENDKMLEKTLGDKEEDKNKG